MLLFPSRQSVLVLGLSRAELHQSLDHGFASFVELLNPAPGIKVMGAVLHDIVLRGQVLAAPPGLDNVHVYWVSHLLLAHNFPEEREVYSVFQMVE